MATEIALNEGKDYIGTHVISGATVFACLLVSKTVGAGTITATTNLSGITEATGTGYARQSIVLGSISNGILSVPGTTWATGAASNWPNNVTAWGITSASSGGIGIYIWDLSTTRNMAVTSRTLTIPTLNWFFINPGE